MKSHDHNGNPIAHIVSMSSLARSSTSEWWGWYGNRLIAVERSKGTCTSKLIHYMEGLNMFTVQITPEYLSGLESNLTGETEGIGPTLGDTMALIQYAKRAIKQTGNVSVEYAWPKEAAASGSGSTSP